LTRATTSHLGGAEIPQRCASLSEFRDDGPSTSFPAMLRIVVLLTMQVGDIINDDPGALGKMKPHVEWK
jgi:hypothetical protein